MDKEYYYGVTRTNDYLAHYGVRGMKWGVRRALSRKSDRALAKQYSKAARKLAKLDRRAASGKQYARRAAALGAGAAAAGTLAAVGTTGVASGINSIGRHGGRAAMGLSKAMKSGAGSVHMLADKVGNKRIRTAMRSMSRGMDAASGGLQKASSRFGVGAAKTAGAVTKWGNSNSINKALTRFGAGNAVSNAGINMVRAGDGARSLTRPLTNKAGSALNRLGNTMNRNGITNNTIARAGAAAAAAGLAGGAAYNAYRAATTKRAARKAAEFRKEMNQAFAGTKYGAPRRKRRR